MIQPTVGRVVHYWGVSDENEEIRHSREPLCALIVYVRDSHMVNLAVFDAGGLLHGRQNVHLRQPEDDVRAQGASYCEWPPETLLKATPQDDPNRDPESGQWIEGNRGAADDEYGAQGQYQGGASETSG